MTGEKILVVEDEEDIMELVSFNLSKAGYEVSEATTGEMALEKAKTQIPDLVVLDLMLPGIDGLKVCRSIKNDSNTSRIPVIMLTAKGDEADIVVGLEMGADDYVTKPFSPKILLARIRAVLRRNEMDVPGEAGQVEIHGITISPGRREVLFGGRCVELTATEFRILHLLARRPGWVFTRGQIVDEVHGEDYPVTDRSVDVQIVGLRKKLGPAGAYIDTVRGVGYRMKG